MIQVWAYGRPEPLQLKIKLKTQVGECTKAEKKQKLLSDLDSLSCEQEIIDHKN